MGRKAMLGSIGGVALVLLAPAAAPPASEATFAGKNGNIVFAGSAGKFRSGLVLVDSNGGHRKVLARSRGLDQLYGTPAFAPSGRRIAYEHSGGHPFGTHIEVIGVNGKGTRQLTSGPGHDPAFSPQGRIAFDSFRHGNSFIFVMRGNGSHVKRLGTGSSPAFSPNAGLIAFNTSRRRMDVMRADGSHRRRIGPGADPDFAPNGKSILFVGQDASGFDQLFVERIDGSHERQITSNSRRNLGFRNPGFSPDAKRIVFEASDVSGGSDDIYMVNADGTGQRQITTDGTSAAPDWGPAPR